VRRMTHAGVAEAGGVVERGVRMMECHNVVRGVEIVRGPWLLAADGAHSVARHQFGIDFVGSSFALAWSLPSPVSTTHCPRSRRGDEPNQSRAEDCIRLADHVPVVE
jgi:hypothetical protein